MAPQISSSARPVLCAVLNVTAMAPDPEQFAARLFEAGVDWIQLRDRDVEADVLYQVACQIVIAARRCAASLLDDQEPCPTAGGLRSAPQVIINRRIDVALASGASGAHLGFDALDVDKARTLLGPDALIGASFHSVAEVEAVCSGGLANDNDNANANTNAYPCAYDYAHLAPIWDPVSKKASRPPLGLETLQHAAGFGLPLLAQGGLDAARAGEAIAAGAKGVAVTGLLTAGRGLLTTGRASEDGASAARQLRHHLDQAQSPTGQILRN